MRLLAIALVGVLAGCGANHSKQGINILHAPSCGRLWRCRKLKLNEKLVFALKQEHIARLPKSQDHPHKHPLRKFLRSKKSLTVKPCGGYSGLEVAL